MHYTKQDKNMVKQTRGSPPNRNPKERNYFIRQCIENLDIDCYFTWNLKDEKDIASFRTKLNREVFIFNSQNITQKKFSTEKISPLKYKVWRIKI